MDPDCLQRLSSDDPSKQRAQKGQYRLYQVCKSLEYIHLQLTYNIEFIPRQLVN